MVEMETATYLYQLLFVAVQGILSLTGTRGKTRGLRKRSRDQIVANRFVLMSAYKYRTAHGDIVVILHIVAFRYEIRVRHLAIDRLMPSF